MCIGYVAKILGRAKFFLAGKTFKSILDIVLTDSLEAWGQMGWFEYDARVNPYGNYVLFKEPPAHWPRAYKGPKTYDRCVSFDSGFCLQLLSFEKPDSNRGGNFDGGFNDESALFKSDWVTKILMPMLYRANTWRFKDHPMHNAFYDFTSNPWTQEGQWVFQTEELMKKDPEKYLFLEGTAYDNPTLHPQYVQNLEEGSSPLIFRVEVLNERLKGVPNCYYPSFEIDKHCTSNTFSYAQNDDGLWIPTFSDYDPAKPLEASLDFNNYICSSIVCQQFPRTLRIINNIYSKQPRKDKTLAQTLALAIAEEYADHLNKVIFLYGDAAGESKSAGSNETFFDQVEDELKEAGWKVKRRVLKFNPAHKERFSLIDRLLTEGSSQLDRLRINMNTCKALIISIQNSPMKEDFTKDKSSEGTTSIQQEYATHLSDCLDYILYRKYNSTKPKTSGIREVRWL